MVDKKDTGARQEKERLLDARGEPLGARSEDRGPQGDPRGPAEGHPDIHPDLADNRLPPQGGLNAQSGQNAAAPAHAPKGGQWPAHARPKAKPVRD